MKTLKCSSCGADIEVDEINYKGTCQYCGTKYEFEKPTTTIINNTTINYVTSNDAQNNNYNSNVAQRINDSSQRYGSKSKYVAVFLCIFLGFYGAHKFYEGKVGMGVLYLFTAGLFLIGWITDIFILLGKPRYYNP